IRAHVRYVRAAPLGAIPGKQLALWVPGLTRRIGRGAVVQDAPVGGPRPSPVERLANAVGIGVVAPCHEISGLSPGAAKDPATAGGGAIVPELCEAGELLAGPG